MVKIYLVQGETPNKFAFAKSLKRVHLQVVENRMGSVQLLHPSVVLNAVVAQC